MKFKIKDKTYVLKKNGMIAIGVAVALLVVILVVTLKPSKKDPLKKEVVAESKLDASYDAKDGIIDKQKYQETILEKSDDAGKEYIESTLFLGDSNTARFLRVNGLDGKPFTTKENTIGVVGMGIDAISTTPCMQFSTGTFTMVKSVELLQPERIIITFGTNNLSGNSTDATSFIERYEKQLEAIEDAYPTVDLIVNAIPPVAKRRAYPNVTMTQIDAYNKAIAEMCDEHDWKFLDSSEALKDQATGFAKQGYTVDDGLHLSASGLNALFKYIRTHSYITEDDRPKPLASIPSIIGVKQNLYTTNPLNNEQFEEDPTEIGTDEPIEEVVEEEPTPTPTPEPTVEPTENPTPTEEVQKKVNFSDCTTLEMLKDKASKNGYTVSLASTKGEGELEKFVLGAVDHKNKTVTYYIYKSKKESDNQDVKPEPKPEQKPEVKPDPKPSHDPKPEPKPSTDPKPEPEKPKPVEPSPDTQQPETPTSPEPTQPETPVEPTQPETPVETTQPEPPVETTQPEVPVEQSAETTQPEQAVEQPVDEAPQNNEEVSES